MKILQQELAKVFNSKSISSIGDGEKIIISQNFDHLLFLCDNFVSAGKLKRGLEGFGRKVEIIASARENDNEYDKNLMPFVSGINKYLLGEIDCLIFLPCSGIIKFDLNQFAPFEIKVNEDYDLQSLAEKLSKMGYERSSLASEVGHFALRGDILDIYAHNYENPVRIEFFGDTVEKISFFDNSTMKNIQSLDSVKFSLSFLPLGQNDCFDLQGTKIIDEPKKIGDETQMLLQSYKTTSFYKEEFYQDFEILLNKSDIVFDSFQILPIFYQNQKIAPRSYLTDFLALKKDIEDFKNLNQSIILFSGDEKHNKIIEDFLTENNMSYFNFNPQEKLKPQTIYISSIAMPYSFSFLKENVTAVGCDSLFRSSVQSFSKSKHSVFYLPKLGDYVVHTFHGIGKCIRIERLKISDIEKDYFVIEYKNGDKLYLPSEEANTISAYIGSEEVPKLSSLGGGEFARLKEKVRASIKEMAISLVEIYKERETTKGFKFVKDSFLENQFASSCGFVETADQAKAIFDVDKDMESDKVMDRLICGDVGFGKTEVALRAGFKAIYNGKQVAFLCPTTILSEQHYRTAKDRFEKFGAKVEVLNRFKTPAQVKNILSRVKDGDVDMLIGTHRLLSQDVVFKDLGLLILDEEQRFGVEHKEKIKDKHRNIDVLTLSATPIPRTLNMSLSGIRDISVIETAPRERLPIQTYLAEESDELIKDVVTRELARGGQAFIIYNRVETIDEFASHIRTLLPNARVGVAHGQMSEKVLAGVVNKLFEGEYNVLISTTLIENGVNLPSANTMVVIEADHLGLSQLYQLRGRIGRGDKLGYAYLTYEKDKILTEDAYKRLEAIKEFSELGSGFKIAMRDLELRGAGNIFGKEQHGHIAKVGYDMFVKLLDEEVREIKGEKIKQKSDVKLEITLSAFISDEYINDSEQRIVYYSRISEISSREEMKLNLQSMQDAFGQVPEQIENLCLLAYLRNLAGDFDVNKIRINKSETTVFLNKTQTLIDDRLAINLKEFSGKLSFDSIVKIKFDLTGTVKEKLEKIIEFFEKSKLSKQTSSKKVN